MASPFSPLVPIPFGEVYRHGGILSRKFLILFESAWLSKFHPQTPSLGNDGWGPVQSVYKGKPEGLNKISFFLSAKAISGVSWKKGGMKMSKWKSPFLIPSEAGIHFNQAVLGSRLRGRDRFSDSLRGHQACTYYSQRLKKVDVGRPGSGL